MTIIEAAREVHRRKTRSIQRRGMPSSTLVLMEDSDLFFVPADLTTFDLMADDWILVPVESTSRIERPYTYGRVNGKWEKEGP